MVALATLRDLLDVLKVAVNVDRARFQHGPAELLKSLRARGESSRSRTPDERARLQWMVRAVDRLFPSGPNCYRRALIEVAVDSHAAREPLHLGLRAEGGTGSGHTWLASSADRGGGYDVELSV
jgi:hypothetical protein